MKFKLLAGLSFLATWINGFTNIYHNEQLSYMQVIAMATSFAICMFLLEGEEN